MDVDSFKKVCVVGWGRSGEALCAMLLNVRKEVMVTESKERSCFDAERINVFMARGVQFEFGGHSEKFMKDSQLLVISPGADRMRPPLGPLIDSLGILCVGEIECAFWFTKSRCIAITGTNGKTTTTYLTHSALKLARARVFLGGNIGTPFSSFVLDTKPHDLIVLEISSFQMETIREFRPYVAALLNIEPDHMDRYATFGEYCDAKLNIFRNQRATDWAVLNKENTMRSTIEKDIRAKIRYFGDEFENENYSCVFRIANMFGVSKIDCQGLFTSFKGLPHRLQTVRAFGGVRFINDSKATNPSSTIWALRAVKTPVILLAGGKDKGLDYASIIPYTRRVKKINLFGEAAGKIKAALSATGIVTETFSSFRETIVTSFNESVSGDSIVLSPMCSSFDMFKNYEERGAAFCEIVNGLPEKS